MTEKAETNLLNKTRKNLLKYKRKMPRKKKQFLLTLLFQLIHLSHKNLTKRMNKLHDSMKIKTVKARNYTYFHPIFSRSTLKLTNKIGITFNNEKKKIYFRYALIKTLHSHTYIYIRTITRENHRKRKKKKANKFTNFNHEFKRR